MIPIAVITICGICWGQQDSINQTVAEVNQHTSNFGVAVLATLFGYDG